MTADPEESGRERLPDRVQTSGHQRRGQNPEQQHECAIDGERRSRSGTRNDCRCRDRFVEVHRLDDPQVVEGTDQGREDCDNGKRDLTGGDDRLQHGELRVEPDGRRDAGEREHQDQRGQRQARGALRKALEVGDLLRFEPGAGEQLDQLMNYATFLRYLNAIYDRALR